MSVTAGDLVGINEPNPFATSFDVAPDSSRIAVEFRAPHEDGTAAIWIGQWQLPAKQLVRTCKADELAASEAHNFELKSELRFSPDGRYLIVLTGPRIRVLSVDNCSTIAVFLPAPLKSRSANGPTIRLFDIARNSIAFLTDTAQYSLPGIKAISEAESAVQVFDVLSGVKQGEFSLPGAFRHLALEPDGRRVALSGVFGSSTRGSEDIRLFDVKTGAVVERFDSGFRWLRAMGNGIPVVFASSSEIVIAPTADSDSAGRYGGRSLRVFDLNTGRMVREITRKHYGPLGVLAISSDGQFAATVSFWENRWALIRRDFAATGARAELLVLRLSDNKFFQVAAPMQQGSLSFTLDQYCLRLSADGSFVALFQDTSVQVYAIRSFSRHFADDGAPSRK